MPPLPSCPSRRGPSPAMRGARSLALLVFLLLPALAFAALDFPALTGRVVDDAHILPPAARQDVETKSKELEEKSGIQLVVATVPSLQDTDIETFANGLFRFWKLGEAKVNNGVLFLIAPNERKMRIEVGYGLEGTLTDALSKIIIATAVTPKFKAGDFGAGVERGVDGIIEVLSGDSAEWEKRIKVRAEHQEPGFDQIVPFIVFALFLFVFFSMLANARGGGRRIYRGGRGPIIYFPPSNDSWSGGSSWGGGGSSWGGDGGGGFSGGGGSSGGGGASGDW
ncbi:TPM domain-containing protein [Methylosinus sp. H3A]|uniref:TPM domain-containing protein n=1 Tax=Methylosinus sp. H3A TaxID=2785786 RepID=UPI0018C21765|nr:TPM domain-containing protein [Methylosinus sp. H3A]MBG0810487.1 TPM domain-containing protein [Methylosinus sp. H3A]